MQVYTLTKAEQELARAMGYLRYQYCREKGAEATRYGKIVNEKTAMEMETITYGAELAFCKITNVYPDFEYEVFNPYDATVRGKTIDVKETHYVTGHLIVKVKKNWKDIPDFYALMIGTYPTFKLVGFFPSKLLLVPERITYDKKYDEPPYEASQDELKPLGTWLKEGNYA